MFADDSTLVIAEISANHRGSLSEALDLVDAISKTGVQFVKFQTYTPQTMTMRLDTNHFRIRPEHELWGGANLYDLYEEAHTPFEWHKALFETARRLGLTPFSTPFDASAVDLLEALEAPMYKVASLEIGDLPLIRYIARLGKPLIISTGAANLHEIDEAVDAAFNGGCSELALLLCTSAYPTQPQDVHLARLELLSNRYGLPVGLSDHTTGLAASILAVGMGATLIERHVTLDRSAGGLDAAFSLEPQQLKTLVREVAEAELIYGQPNWVELDAENESRRLKRSLYFLHDMEEDEIVTDTSIGSRRPAGGLPPKHFERLLGRRVCQSVKRGTPVTWEHLSGNPES